MRAIINSILFSRKTHSCHTFQVNVIAFDPEENYVAVGCRDKTFQIFDSSTFSCIKRFETPGWVTSITWSPFKDHNTVAVRSENKCISVLNLSSIQMISTQLLPVSSSSSSPQSSLPNVSEHIPALSWSRNGRFLAYSQGKSVALADTVFGFKSAFSFDLEGAVVNLSFCQASGNEDWLAALDENGYLTIFQVQATLIKKLGAIMIEPHLKALAWSKDGSLLVTGGRKKLLHIVDAKTLKLSKKVELSGRIWDLDFASIENEELLAVALGDYTVAILNASFEPLLRIPRTRTVRCLAFHPCLPLIAIGDGLGMVCIVDISAEEFVCEFDVQGRVNCVAFSPVGDHLIVGTDSCRFSLHDTLNYYHLQTFESHGFALAGAFSPAGSYLALGSISSYYAIVSLGPFLGIDLAPLDFANNDVSSAPYWAVSEVLFRSVAGPSFAQRLMEVGDDENLRRLALILRQYPDVVYTFNRKTKEGCFETALKLQKSSLLKLSLTALVDGSLDASRDGRKSILTTEIPQQGREGLLNFIQSNPPDLITEVLEKITFAKVPFTEAHDVESGKLTECGSSSFLDPWIDRQKRKLTSTNGKTPQDRRGRSTGAHLTPAVLPLPGLGELDFLSTMLSYAPPAAFDNEAMNLVLRVMWKGYIQKYFLVDALVFTVYYSCWVILLELIISSPDVPISIHSSMGILSMIVLVLNAAYLSKEIIQSQFGQQWLYFSSIMNAVDLLSIFSVFGYILAAVFAHTRRNLIPLAVVATLLLTIKLLSYLRGFSKTGWLISVLQANFRDVRGFLVILFSIMVGFSVSFRLLFDQSIDQGYDSLRECFLSTFEMTILGVYDPSLLADSTHTAMAAFVFVLAATCILIVCLNALISILADSFAKVQEHAAANRRREQAALIVEYMTILPHGRRRKIEKATQWFHVLLEVDAKGDLLVDKQDWQGGLNALRHDMEVMSQQQRESNKQMLDQMRSDMESQLADFKLQVIGLLNDLSEDVKRVHDLHSEAGVRFSGKRVANAVKVVKSIHRRGGALLQKRK